MQPGPRDLEQAEMLLRHGSPEEVRVILVSLVQVTRKEWPDCRSLSGAAQKYLGDALHLVQQQAHREAARQKGEAARMTARQEEAGRQQSERQIQTIWDALPEDQRRSIEQQVRSRLGKSAPESFVRRLCLEELSRRSGVSDQ
jgi:hypothetical protein